jgi:hypothetical protein
MLTGDYTSYTLGYLDVPAMNQYIDVDYVKIYVPDPAPPGAPTLSVGGLAITALLMLAAGAGRLRAGRTP